MLSISSPFSWHAAEAAGHLLSMDDGHTILCMRSLRTFTHILQIDRQRTSSIRQGPERSTLALIRAVASMRSRAASRQARFYLA
jgi:hypothetical protein